MTSPKDISDLFGRFFVVAGYLPALALLTLIQWLIVPGLPVEVQNQVSRLSEPGYIQEITILVIVPVFLAAILVSLTESTIQLFAGQRLFQPGKGTSRQEAKLGEFDDLVNAIETRMANLQTDPFVAAEVQALIQQLRKLTGGELFFERSGLRTTRLGNVLALLNEYPDRRYGMNAGIIWARLRSVLPKEFEERLKSQNTSFMFMLNLSLCSLVFGLTWILFGITSLIGWSQVNVFVWVAVLICVSAGAHLFYRAAVSEAFTLVETMTTAYDMYRGNLLEKLGLVSSSNLKDEKKLWVTLTSFLLLGDEQFDPSKAIPPPVKQASETKSLASLWWIAPVISLLWGWVRYRQQQHKQVAKK
jgi:hypothetical protein